MRVLVTGGSGLLGRTLARHLRSQHAVRTLDRVTCDVTEATTVQRVFAQLRPQVVLHCAALTRVEVCETRPDLAYRTNAQGSANVAAACQRTGARLIAFSTAYVFSGAGVRPSSETDEPAPKTAYGRSKLAAEQLIAAQCDDALVLRLSWLYGVGDTAFGVRLLDEAARPGPALRAPVDASGNPTSADAVALAVQRLLNRPDARGVWHLAARGEVNWFELAQVVAERTGSGRRIVPCSSADLPRPDRPLLNARLANSRLVAQGEPEPAHWLEQLAAHLDRHERRAAA